MREKGSFKLVRHFLRNSPRNQLQKYRTVFQTPLIPLQLGVTPLSNRSYIHGFLKSVQVFGQPTSSIRRQGPMRQEYLKKILKQMRMVSRYSKAANQTQQLLLCIKEMTGSSPVSIINYQELQQRIVIAKYETVMEVKQRLVYLFKILLNKRDKLAPQSIELDANLQLSQTIIKAFQKNEEFGQNNKEWSKLQAMDKLMRARQYKKKGYNAIAINNFQQIFRNEAATYQVRLQALKVICNEGEQQGDVSKLQPLVLFTHEKGEKQYQQYIKIIIERIKQSEHKTSDG